MQIISAEQPGPNRVVVGEPFVIELDEAPTTGYKWELETGPAFMQVLGDKFEVSASPGIGGGGKRSFILHISKPGKYTLKATLRRPWEGPARYIKQHLIIIHAK
jgi:inhibitor of cysteine peptidase